ncbi:unnamed protein product [Brachionus calyciflorus]|uniref:CCHC-type domain-containing protein n=1 Tax=Brachionus calyciflorus TaxID=104777 RepID=A0A814DCS3_9BILA|nr:unnamed protein product [Brachionus calyciflorus]
MTAISDPDPNFPPLQQWSNLFQSSHNNSNNYADALKASPNPLATQFTYALLNQFFHQNRNVNLSNVNNPYNHDSNPPKRARTTTSEQYSMNQSHDMSNLTENEPKNKTYVTKFINKKEFPSQLRSYIKLLNEIKRCKPDAKIQNAYVNSKNQLIIGTDCEKSATYLSSDWISDAFINGIQKIDSVQKFYIALHNLNTDFDVDDLENKEYMLKNYKITNMLRIIKKSINKPMDLVKAIINDREDFNKIIDKKIITIGCSRIRVSPWKFDIRPDQCFHCQKIGHFAETCPDKSKSPTCLRCAKKHSHKNCPCNDPNKYRCSNCNGNHPACSKSCELIQNEIKRKKDLLEKKAEKASSKFTRVESAEQTSNNKKGAHPNKIENSQMNSIILFIIEILKKFNDIHEKIYEKPNEIGKLVSDHFGNSCGKFIENHLSRTSAEEEMDDEDTYYNE